MKLSTGIIVIVLLFTFMEVANGTSYRIYDGHKLGYGCHKGYCWTYCGASWVSSFLFLSFIHLTIMFQNQKHFNQNWAINLILKRIDGRFILKLLYI